MKDELILDKSAEAIFFAKLVKRLEKQLRDLGVAPVCQLPENRSQIADDDDHLLEEMKQRQKELESGLLCEAQEKVKMRSMLDALNAERINETQLFAKYKTTMEERMEDLQRRQREQERKMEEDRRKLEEEEERKRVLEEAARRATREMMDMQAKLAEERELGFFSRFRRKLSIGNLANGK
jgi:chromosome segregation ATPase